MSQEERTGWRDAGLSARHRSWGWDCPAVDIDFLLVEYDLGKPIALIEYKNEHATPQQKTHPSFNALIELGNRASIPVFACRYKDDFSNFRVIPLNDFSKEYVPKRITLTELEYVNLLYKLRGRKMPEELSKKLGCT